ncbi:cytochrome c oxidase assembly protein [Hahella sp. SMD15-11]|uniref:Cytochrome c oxidase assembly protein CtaG n=1 Tax=Thermohahella caldifontis TaxID=3142973 RepID=A0AB39UTB5_9GAMM
MDTQPDSLRAKNHRLVVRMVVIVAAMFGFAFALVPLYQVFCVVTGLNGKTADEAWVPPAEAVVDESRWVTVQFISQNHDGMPWQFAPEVYKVKVHPGKPTRVSFRVANPTDRHMVAQAVPSVSPSEASRYFHKIECFCFGRQELAPGEAESMPLQFVVDVGLPETIRTVTLSYTLYDVTEPQDNNNS